MGYRPEPKRTAIATWRERKERRRAFACLMKPEPAFLAYARSQAVKAGLAMEATDETALQARPERRGE